MRNWSTACPDWKERIVKREPLITAPVLFPEVASYAREVYNSLRMVDAPGSPLLSEVTRQWIYDFNDRIFGSYDPESGRRMITEFFMLISKKNAKSTNAAGIGMTALTLNWRESAEFIILSPTIEVAGNSFKPAADMVRKDEELSEIFHVQDHIRTITHRVTGATLKVVAADSNTVSGKKTAGLIVDELWLFGKMPNAEDMLREAAGGLASRPEGFVVYLTTQSNEPPQGVFKTKLDYARDVRDGIIEDKAFLPVIYEFPREMVEAEEHLKPSNFYISNPNLGASVDEVFLQREFQKAQKEGPESLNGFLAKHLNVEIGMNLRRDRWPGADFWQKNASTRCKTLEQIIEQSEVISIGIDGGGLDDLLGLAVVGREKDGDKWLSWHFACAHKSVLERRKEIADELTRLKNSGDLMIVENAGEDVEFVANVVHQVFDSGLLYQVGLDPASIGGILDSIVTDDYEEAGIKEKLVAVNQGWRLSGSIKTTERHLSTGKLLHDGTDLMKWCVGNAKIKPAGNAIIVTKAVSGTAKIDPLMALFNAVFLMSLNPPAQTTAGFDLNDLVIGG